VTPFIRQIDFTAPPLIVSILNGEIEAATEVIDTNVTLEEHEAACDAAYRKGFQEANEALTKQIFDQRSEVAQLQDAVFKSLAEQSSNLAQQVSQILPELVMDIARRVMVGMKPDSVAVKCIVEETLSEIAPGSMDVEVMLHPDDLALVSGIDKEFDQKYPGIKLSTDPELIPGDCRAKSRFGMIDARIFTKLQNVGRSLK
jgi:flagellar biosynthesis/type III secretory pathway protein FliH